LGLMLKAAVDKNNAIALSSTWSDAYFMRAYALQDLRRLSEAKATLQQALKMSPFNAQYLTEMGEIYALEKNWSKSEQLYREAEDSAPLSPEVSRAYEVPGARRGRSEEHTSELQSLAYLVCRLLLEKKNFQSTSYEPFV